MTRRKQRENYGKGSVFAVQHKKLDAKGNVVLDDKGKPVMLQDRDRRGRPIWRICVTLGTEEYIDEKGNKRKRQRKVAQKRFHGTLKEARSVAERLVKEYESLVIDKTSIPFSALCAEWLALDRLKCSSTQLKQYETRLGYMARFFEDKRIIDIEKEDVKAALTAIRDMRNRKPFSDTTMEKILCVTKRVFEYACDEDYIARNPCRGISAPSSKESNDSNERKALDEKEAFALRCSLDEKESEAYREFDAKEKRQAEWGHASGRTSLYGLSQIGGIMATRLLLATGARRGEILGLVWRNVDLKEGTIRIAQSLNVEGKIKSPKTSAGVRSLYIDARTLKHLRRWKTFQAEALRQITVDGEKLEQTGETPVITSDVGGWIGATNYSRWWRSFRRQIGFCDLLTHELRHTHITLLRGNVPEEMIATRVGHSYRSPIVGQYLHELPAQDKPAANCIERILYGPKIGKGNVIKFTRRTA